MYGDELDDKPVGLPTTFFPAWRVLADVNPDQRGGPGEGRGELAPSCGGGQPGVGEPGLAQQIPDRYVRGMVSRLGRGVPSLALRALGGV